VSARWWQMSLRAQPLARLLGWSRPLVWTSAGLTISGCAEMWAENEPDPAQAALEAQREDGWNVGDEGQPLAFPGAQSTDVTGTEGWRGALTTLTLHLTPAQALWQPYFAPALFQSLEAPRSADLRAVVRPIFTPEMAVASRRGEAPWCWTSPDQRRWRWPRRWRRASSRCSCSTTGRTRKAWCPRT